MTKMSRPLSGLRLRSEKKQIKKIRAVIYDIKDGKPYFLILHRTLHWKGWEFLKETIEKGETHQETLIRGIREETRLKEFKVMKRLNKQEKWRADGIDYIIADTFLVRASMKEKISLKQEIIEHDNYQWVDRKTALRKLTWPKTKEIFREINENLFV